MFPTGPASLIRDVVTGEPIMAECRRFYEITGSSKRRQFGQLLFLLSKKRRLTSYATFNLAEYIDWNYDIMNDTIRKELSWSAPSDSEHMDCMISPIQKYIHNRRFPGLEMKKLTLARHVMSGRIKREEALLELKEKHDEKYPEAIMNLFLNNIGMSRKEFDMYIDMGPRHLQYDLKPPLPMRLASKLFLIRNAGSY
jgi:hypothetical protein